MAQIFWGSENIVEIISNVSLKKGLFVPKIAPIE
jgi:hypothetical protein